MQPVNLQTQDATLYLLTALDMKTMLSRQPEEFPDVQFCHATGTKAHTEEPG